MALSLLAVPAASAELVTLDGRFGDWQNRDLAFDARDATGDAVGDFDVVAFRGLAEGTTLLIDLQLASSLNLQAGPTEQGTLVLSVRLADGKTLAIDLRTRTATVDGAPVAWDTLRFTALPTYAATRQELRIDLGPLGAKAGDAVELSLSGSDDVDPSRVTLAEPVTPVEPATLDRAADSDWRLAVMNVLWDGQADAGRGRQIGRLLAATDPDIVALQEAIAREDLPDRDAGEMPDAVTAAERVANVLDRRLEGDWNAVADGLGCVVASRFPLQGVSLGEGVRGAAAVVDVDGNGFGEGDPLVVSVHLKCCGFADSDEDHQRVAQVQAMIETLQPLADRHPIVVAGDYNLVGSRRPLDLLAQEPLGLIEAMLLQAGEATAATWRGLSPTESFWPGRLDLVCHDASLSAKKAFVLDTADLSPGTLSRHGLLATDSLASDHLLMVLDVAVADLPFE